MNRILTLTLLLLSFMPQAAAADAQNLFTGKDAGALVSEALAKAGTAGDIKVSVNEARDEDIFISGNSTIAAELDNFTVDKARKSWQALLLLKEDGRNLAPMKLTGRYDEMTRVPVLKRSILPQETIGEEDIDWSSEAASRLRKNVVTDAHDLIGKSPRHAISQGRPIRTDEIAGPAIISKGARVTLLFKSRNLEIKTLGEALEPGALGEVVRVRNLTSKAVIQGVVEQGDVRVSSPDSDTAEAM